VLPLRRTLDFTSLANLKIHFFLPVLVRPVAQILRRAAVDRNFFSGVDEVGAPNFQTRRSLGSSQRQGARACPQASPRGVLASEPIGRRASC
jgi:hypothetical protein